jgi:ornithine--oxo-acid transaminase
MKALEVLKSEDMAQNATKMGELLRQGIANLNSPFVTTIRGKGLLNAIVIKHENPEASWDLCLHLKDLGLLAKPTHGDKIRFAPPLIINEQQINEAVAIIGKALEKLA